MVIPVEKVGVIVELKDERATLEIPQSKIRLFPLAYSGLIEETPVAFHVPRLLKNASLAFGRGRRKTERVSYIVVIFPRAKQTWL